MLQSRDPVTKSHFGLVAHGGELVPSSFWDTYRRRMKVVHLRCVVRIGLADTTLVTADRGETTR